MSWIDFPKLYPPKDRDRTPIAPDRLCRIRFRDGHETAPLPAKSWRWCRFKNQAAPSVGDPVAYEVVGS